MTFSNKKGDATIQVASPLVKPLCSGLLPGVHFRGSWVEGEGAFRAIGMAGGYGANVCTGGSRGEGDILTANQGRAIVALGIRILCFQGRDCVFHIRFNARAERLLPISCELRDRDSSQNADDGDDDEEFDQRKTFLILQGHDCILPFCSDEVRVVAMGSSFRLLCLVVCSFRFSPFCLFAVSVGFWETLCVSVVFLI